MKRVILTILVALAIIGAQAQTEKKYMLKQLTNGTMVKTPLENVKRLSFVDQKTFTVNGVEFRMIKVVGGTYVMGKNLETGYGEDPHNVTLSDYYIGETEVTQELWQAVMGSNPSEHKGTKLPVEKVSWEDCQAFVTKLMSLTGRTFRLPTEAEWEFAAKGGNLCEGYLYSGSNVVGDVAWCKDNANKQSHEVATKAPNELGLYDMSGNLDEWCQDWYASYSTEDQTNPTGPTSGKTRVTRGGYFNSSITFCRTHARFGYNPTYHLNLIGLRLALTP